MQNSAKERVSRCGQTAAAERGQFARGPTQHPSQAVSIESECALSIASSCYVIKIGSTFGDDTLDNFSFATYLKMKNFSWKIFSSLFVSMHEARRDKPARFICTLYSMKETFPNLLD
jgi:hypothetical protein